MKVLFFGDIYGKYGRRITISKIEGIIAEFNIDIVIANGENLAGGKGITDKTANSLFRAGVDCFTSGNHLWDKKSGLDFIRDEDRILKPANYSKAAYGNIFYFVKRDQFELAVINLAGQVFMNPANSPYEELNRLLPKLKERTNNIFVDLHAEATAEKRAFGFMFDGQVSAIVGTHTHIQTADEEILQNGTAYISDVGMTGPHDSVIGVSKDIILDKIKTGMPIRYETTDKGLQINAVVIEIDEETGKAKTIQRIRRKYGNN